MCGISGKIYFNKQEITRYELQQMTSKIKHRGPDSTGYYVSKKRNVGFGFNRLAIIDLSKKGNQPMSYLDRYIIVFNGEVYNFQSEREKLIKLGFKFNSKSDTEVILALYSKYKEKCLSHLRGMFSFVIYDTHEETLFIARDRVGKKPFKYFMNDNCFIFASELKAILTQKEVKAEPDYIAIQKYFLYGYVPSPFTGFVGIKKLEPGHYIKIDIKRKICKKTKYWEPRFKEKLHLSEKEWSNRILDTLEESTKLRMISDVPIGAFLSGGVDSSAVVAMMALNSKDNIKTFTVKYENKRWSEEKYAKNIAKRYHTDHTEILAKPTDIKDLPEIAYQYEEPFSDNSALVSMMVCREARKHVTVTLNGDGGDENFAGYPNRYMRLKRDVDYGYWISKLRPLSALKISKVTNFLNKSNLPLYERFVSYNQVFPLNEILNMATGPFDKTMTTENLYKYVRRTFQNFNGKDLKDAGLKFDLMYFLPDLLLTKMDIASMANSLETRSPLLDHNMIELGCKIPFRLKVKGGESKYIFKKALEKIVPKENLYRPKMGFTISLEDWFKGDLSRYFQKTALNKKALLNNFIDLEKINLDANTKKWNLLMLELWLKNYF
jgi:asparagine synthase (glutamine-hydrolysing)